MSTQLEDICLSQGMPIYRPVESSDALEVIATGEYPMMSHWFKIFERNNGQIGVILEFPTCERGDIAKVEEFCTLLSEHFLGSCGNLYFDTARQHFYLGSFAGKEMLASHLTTLAFCCDTLIPLCQMVGKQGWWDSWSVDLGILECVQLSSA